MLATILHTITAAIAAHPGIATWAAATLLALYRTRTPAQWVALGETNARLQGLFKLARGGGVDPARLLEGAEQIVTGRRVVDPRDARIAELEAALATYQRRAMAAHAVTLEVGADFDPTRTVNLAPVDRDSQRGSVGLRALLAFVVVLAVVVPLGAAVTGCPSSLPPVAGCEPLAQACIADRPHVCSASQRWERAGSVSCGEVRGVCVVTDGRAHCAAPADAGAP